MNELIKQVEHIVWFTSGQCLIFDNNGEQICELQKQFTKDNKNINLFKEIANNAQKFTICKFREWTEDLNKEDFFTLTNLNHL